jgi:hypothetical protein
MLGVIKYPEGCIKAICKLHTTLHKEVSMDFGILGRCWSQSPVDTEGPGISLDPRLLKGSLVG